MGYVQGIEQKSQAIFQKSYDSFTPEHLANFERLLDRFFVPGKTFHSVESVYGFKHQFENRGCDYITHGAMTHLLQQKGYPVYYNRDSQVTDEGCNHVVLIKFKDREAKKLWCHGKSLGNLSKAFWSLLTPVEYMYKVQAEKQDKSFIMPPA